MKKTNLSYYISNTAELKNAVVKISNIEDSIIECLTLTLNNKDEFPIDEVIELSICLLQKECLIKIKAITDLKLCGTLIFACGSKESRLSLEWGKISLGPTISLNSLSVDDKKRKLENIVHLLHTITGKSKKKITNDINNNVVLDFKSAKKYGLLDNKIVLDKNSHSSKGIIIEQITPSVSINQKINENQNES